MSPLSLYSGPLLLMSLSLLITGSILLLTRLTTILIRPRNRPSMSSRPYPSCYSHPTHLLIVLGSGGHTTEMLDTLCRVPSLISKFTHRTYIVTGGDGFSVKKASDFEASLSGDTACREVKGKREGAKYDVVIVRRARRVHQSLLSTPWSALWCMWDCLKVLKGTHPDQTSSRTRSRAEMRQVYPDLILTNGPGTGVCVVIASIVLLFLGFSGTRFTPATNKIKASADPLLQWQDSGQMRSIFIESWARVKTLSLSGNILLPFVDRFLVQWPAQAGRGGGKAEFVGALVA